jgi:pilus assembly protein FimV
MSMDAEFTALDLNLDAAAAGAASSGSQLSALDEASSALGFDIGGDSIDAASSPDDALDFGLDLDDGGDAVAGGADFDFSLDGDLGGDDVSEETVKLDLGAGRPGDDFEDDLDTVRLQSPEMDAADSAISDLGMDLNLDMDMDASNGGGSSIGVDTAFDGVFDDGLGATSHDDMALSMDGSDLIPPTAPRKTDVVADFPEIDLDFDAEKSRDALDADEYESTQFMLRDVPASESSSSATSGDGHTLMLGGGLTGEVDEVQTKLDLAQAYIDMGDTDGAKGIIDEVLSEGNKSQKQAAMGLLSKLASS